MVPLRISFAPAGYNFASRYDHLAISRHDFQVEKFIFFNLNNNLAQRPAEASFLVEAE
jgi:hypothetical protein